MYHPGLIESLAARIGALIRNTGAPSSDAAPHRAAFWQAQFNKLALELHQAQRQAIPAYDQFCIEHGHRVVSAWREIPPLPVSAFKELEITCLSRDRRLVEFHSSGTTAEAVSRHFHCADSIALYELSIWSWFRACFAVHRETPSLVFLTPPPSEAPYSSLVHMFQTLNRKLNPAAARFCGGVEDSGDWTLDPDLVLRHLEELAGRGQPVGMLGTAFHFVHLLDALARDRGNRLLPPGSWILETGGYKGRSRTLPKEELHRNLSRCFGVPPDRILREYGMCELSSQAYAMSAGPTHATHTARHLRFPPWAQVRVLSPETGQEVSEGEQGLITVLDLANAWSVMAIQTEDLGLRVGDGFELIGRVPGAYPRGCSYQLNDALGSR